MNLRRWWHRTFNPQEESCPPHDYDIVINGPRTQTWHCSRCGKNVVVRVQDPDEWLRRQ